MERSKKAYSYKSSVLRAFFNTFLQFYEDYWIYYWKRCGGKYSNLKGITWDEADYWNHSRTISPDEIIL